MLGVAENRLRVIAPEVGGGFGSKLNVYAEEALMGFVAMKIGKPVKWIESRRENFLTHHPRPRPRRLLRDRGEEGRHHPRAAPETDPGSRRLPPTADPRHPHAFRADDAGPLPLQATFTRTSSASSPIASPPTPIAAQDARKPPTASSA